MISVRRRRVWTVNKHCLFINNEAVADFPVEFIAAVYKKAYCCVRTDELSMDDRADVDKGGETVSL
jgi:hypothetical protein